MAQRLIAIIALPIVMMGAVVMLMVLVPLYPIACAIDWLDER
jgi:hypothetical protein